MSNVPAICELNIFITIVFELVSASFWDMSFATKSLGLVVPLTSNSALLKSLYLPIILTLKSYVVFADKSLSDTSLFVSVGPLLVGSFITVCKLEFAPLLPLTSIE